MNQRMDIQEFEIAYHSYKHLLYRIALSYVKRGEDAEDIVQEAFYRRLYKAPEFMSGEHEKRWMIRVTVNLCKNHVKSYWYRKRAEEEVPEKIFPDSGEQGIWEEVLRLPEKCKAPMYLHYYEGYTCREIADMLGCRESAVKMRLKRGRELLKLELSEGGM